MKDEATQEKLNEELVRLAHFNELKIHLVLKDGSWRNGFVVQVFGSLFEFKDSKNDKEAFFYKQVKSVEPFQEPKR